MTASDALNILTNYNKWRRGEIDTYYFSPKQVGLALERAAEALRKEAKQQNGDGL